MVSFLNLALIHIQNLDENTTIVKMLKNWKGKMGFNNGPVLLAVKLPWSINCFYYEKNDWNFELFARLNFQVVVGYCYILFDFFLIHSSSQ